MTALPRRSDGVLSTFAGDHVVVYDLVEAMRHRLSPVGGFVLAACDGSTTVEVAAAELAEAAGVDAATTTERIESILDDLRRIELIERETTWEPPTRRGVLPSTLTDDQRKTLLTSCSAGTTTARHASATVVGEEHRVLDRVIRFRGEDPDLIATVDDYLGTAVGSSGESAKDDLELGPGGAITGVEAEVLEFGVYETESDEYDLVTDDVVSLKGLDTLLRRLVTVTNEYAVASDSLLTLHAAGVRDPDGRIVTFPAESGAGKSTLAAAFIAKGWDYLGDEAVGFAADGTTFGYPKRIAMFSHSRAVVGLEPHADANTDPTDLHDRVERLAGPVGPTDLFVFPGFEAGAHLRIDSLEAHESLDVLLANTLNLAHVGQVGLDTLVHLAETVPARRLTHGDALDAVDAITALLDDISN